MGGGRIWQDTLFHLIVQSHGEGTEEATDPLHKWTACVGKLAAKLLVTTGHGSKTTSSYTRKIFFFPCFHHTPLQYAEKQ